MRGFALLASALLLSSPSFAGVPATLPGVFNGSPPSHGHDFVTITHAGNRDMLESERVLGSVASGFPSFGGVKYEYRIGRTEVAASQWINFIKLAWPVAQEIGYNPYDGEVTSYHIADLSPAGAPNYILRPGQENMAVNVSWRMAAMYCNWLHNGAPTGPNVDLNVFRQGAYNTSTFINSPPFPGGPMTDQATRSEGALFWIPTLDEWTKAVYYDPNRYGSGQEGYRRYPYGDTPPITGNVGDPNAQTGGVPGGLAGGQPPVGSFPSAMTPWGLLDAAGSLREWTETQNPADVRARIIKGSSVFGSTSADGNDVQFFATPIRPTFGFRIASAIPLPSAFVVLSVGVVATSLRRRRCDM